MHRLRVLIARGLGLLSRRRRIAELDQERQFHLEMQAEENARHGMNREEAWRAASRSFGSRRQMEEAYREQAGLAVLDVFAQDMRYGVRPEPGARRHTCRRFLEGRPDRSASCVTSRLRRDLPTPASDPATDLQ